MFKVLAAEYDAVHKEDFEYGSNERNSFWLIVLIHTPVELNVDGYYIKYPENSIMLFRPHQVYHYRACDNTYANDYTRFITDDDYYFNAKIPAVESIPFEEAWYYHRLFQLITTEFVSSNPNKELLMEKLMQVIFTKISFRFDFAPAQNICKSVYDLKDEIFKHPEIEWTLPLMAKKINLSVSHLENTYRQTFDITCMGDVITARITLAKRYLKNSRYSVAEIIPLCGYTSAEHFFRQFKKLTGLTPNQYRKNS